MNESISRLLTKTANACVSAITGMTVSSYTEILCNSVLWLLCYFDVWKRVRSKVVPIQAVKVDRGSGDIHPFILNNVLNNITEGYSKPINGDGDLRLSGQCCWRFRVPGALHHVEW
jgi:hypothetical protein